MHITNRISRSIAAAFLATALISSYFIATPFVSADQDPIGCTGAGFTMFMDVFESDGVTPATVAIEGATLKYQTTLDHAGGANCNISGGTLTITTPDGTVTPLGAVPLITEAGSAFISSQVSYVVDAGDVLSGNVTGTSDWSNGTSHRNPHQTLNGDSEISTPFLAKLEVEKTVNESFDRSWTWDIQKTITNDNDLLLAEGESYTVNYEIEVTPTDVDDNWAVSGDITIHNPNAGAVEITDVTDIVDGTAATVVCGVTFPHDLVGGGDLVCSYTATEADGLDGTEDENTATVVTTIADIGNLVNVPVDYGNTPATETDECVTVNDTFNFPGTPTDVEICADDADKTIAYSVTVGPDTNQDADIVVACDNNSDHPNIADLVTNDEGITDSDGANLHVVVNCTTGCTLTQGYWKTHSREGKAPYDGNWANLLGGQEEDTIFFLSTYSWYTVFWTPVGGRPYYQLAHQYMAAKLNQLNGAGVPANVAAAMLSAEALFNNPAYGTPAQIDALKGKNAQSIRQQFTSLAGVLGSYNEGNQEVPHCDEQNP